MASDLDVQVFRMAIDYGNVVRNQRARYGDLWGHPEFQARKRSFIVMVVVHERRPSNVSVHNLARTSLFNSLCRYGF